MLYEVITLDAAFTLVSDGRKLVDAPATSDPAERLASLFGSTLAAQLVPVEHHDGYLTVVITSYSIHYTKLYEVGASTPTRWTRDPAS